MKLAYDKIWVGWRHLYERVEDLESAVLEGAMLDKPSEDGTADKILKLICKEEPRLLAVATEKAKIERGSIARLHGDVYDCIDEAKHRFVYCRRFVEVLDAGNRRGRFHAPIPYLPAPLPPAAPSPFQQQRFEAFSALDALCKAFLHSLDCEPDTLTPAQWWGRILTSALLYGGLLRTDLLKALPAALADRDEQLLWLWLDLGDKKGSKHSEPIGLRWFPDPLTRLLLAGGCKLGIPPFPTSKAGKRRPPMALIKAYARVAGYDDRLPGTFTTLKEMVATKLHLYLPPFMVHYLTGGYASTSLPETVWKRVIDPPDTWAVKLPEHKRRETCPYPGEAKNGEVEKEDDDSALWPLALRKLAIQIRNTDRKTFSRWVENEGRTLLPAVRLLAQWVDEWLYRGRHGRKPLAKRTVYSMVNSIGGRLVGQLGKESMLGKEAAFYLELYQIALEDSASIGVRRRVAHALRSFHDFLEKKHDAPKIEDSGLFRVSGKVGGNVDANLLCLDTFFMALKWIRDESGQEKDVTDAMRCIASLGFFAGLRRSEAIGLAVDDLEVCKAADGSIVHVDLLVRPNAIRRLKTRSSQRVLPVSQLMPEVELNRLVQWHECRVRVASNKMEEAGSDPLFYIPSLQRPLRDTDPLLEDITEALQRAAHDPSLRFHHLRHSFATWQLYKHQLAERPCSNGDERWPAWFLNTIHQKRREEVVGKEHEAVLGSSPTNRRSLLQVSQLLGHSSADITLSSYVHLLDLMVATELRRMAPVISTRTIKTLSGYSDSYSRALKRGGGGDAADAADLRQAVVLERIAKRILMGGEHEKGEREPKPPVDFAGETKMDVPDTLEGRAVLVRQLLGNAEAVDEISHETIEERYAVSGGIARKLVERIRDIPDIHILARQRVKDKGKGYGKSALIDRLGKEEEAFFESILKRLDTIWMEGDGSDKQLQAVQKQLREVIKSFRKNWVPGSHFSVHFPKVPAADNWIWLLRCLGLGDGISVEHRPRDDSTAGSEFVQRRYWEKALSKKGGKITVRASRRSSEFDGVRGSVIVKVDLGKVPDEITPYKKVTALYPVRMALVVWLITLAWPRKGRSKKSSKGKA